jgi:hypothetical protein
MDIQNTRKTNLLALLRDYESATHFALVAGISEGYLSQVRSGHRSLGERKARVIEYNLGLESGWLDTPRDAPRRTTQSAIADDVAICEVESIPAPDTTAPSYPGEYSIRFTQNPRKTTGIALKEKQDLMRDLLDTELSAEQVRTIRSYLTVVAAQS